jgi:hypothetical protein
MFSAACLLALTGLVAAQTQGKTQANFAPGGEIKMELHAGGYNIKPGADDKIVVSYKTDTEAQFKEVKANITVNGREARIYTNGPDNNFEVTIEIPAKSNLFIRMTAGDLEMSGIRGSKDVESHAGNVDIDIGRTEDYGHVDASVNAGDLDAQAFQVSKGGLFRSFHKLGPGQNRLHVHVGAGDLVLTASGGSGAKSSFL